MRTRLLIAALSAATVAAAGLCWSWGWSVPRWNDRMDRAVLPVEYKRFDSRMVRFA